MCLSGVDYFSTLGYQPGIAVLAAGALAPLATLILVAVTLFGAVPVYRRIAQESPHGQGSISVLGRFVPGWKGKILILALLGFAATDFMITITLSSADASAHALHSTSTPWRIPVTVALIFALGVIFYRGFKEAISIAVTLVTSFLILNAVIIGVGLYRVIVEPVHLSDWQHQLTDLHASPWMMVLMALIVFPKLALGLSGFETGVSVMPLINPGREGNVEGRIKRGRRLLLVSATIMSAYLITSSIVVTALVPAEALAEGGSANGRALAWLAHEQFGDVLGGAYDVVTIAILWFAGASAMAGMLALIPKYLPRFGMAPEWASRTRPMVLVLVGIAFVITLIFRADVDAQAGAYATGVLVLIFSGSIAVTIVAKKKGERRAMRLFAGITVIMGLTLAANIVERPEGMKVAAAFIVAILAVSFVSRVHRAYELRGSGVIYDATAERIIDCLGSSSSRMVLIPHAVKFAPGAVGAMGGPLRITLLSDLKRKEIRVRQDNRLGDKALVFIEITVRDASEFAAPVRVSGRVNEDGAVVLNVSAVAVPNGIAAVALDLQRRRKGPVDIFFEWSDNAPWKESIRFLFTGRGQNAVVTREILRRAEGNLSRRPQVHVS